MSFLNIFKSKKEPSNVITDYGKVHKFKSRNRLQDNLIWLYIDDNNILHNKDGSFTSVFEFRGADMDSATPDELIHYNRQINNIIMSLGTGYALWLEVQRHFSTTYDKSDMPTQLLQQMEDERAEYYDSKAHFESTYYFVLHYEPPADIKNKVLNFFIEDKKTVEDNQKIYEDTIHKFKDNVTAIGNMLKSWVKEIHLLDPDELVTYLHSTISTERYDLVYNPNQYVSDYIVDSSVLGGYEMKIGNKFMKIITIKSFPNSTFPGNFDVLNKLNFEYRWVSRFIPLSKTDAHEELKNKQQHYAQSEKDLTTQIREAITNTPMPNAVDEVATQNKFDAGEAILELGQDFASFGFYTMCLIVLDNDKDTCQLKADKVKQVIQSMGGVAFIEDINSVDAWFGSLPGHWKANVRRPVINSLNFCHLAPLTSTWAGQKYNEQLKGAVLLYTDTVGSTPFRFSLHQGEVGHTMIVGPSGSGKSVLLNTIEAHFTKYKNANVYIFDKAASSRALTMGVGGNFYNLAQEGSGELSFQPLANIDDPNEIKWAKEWILAYLKLNEVRVTPQIDNYVWEALKSLTTMPKDQRTITGFCTMVQNEEIRLALKQLTMSGSYGKLFDNDKDFSGKGSWQVYEMETIMNTPSIVPPTLDYLFHRIETNIKEAVGPSIIVMDECWLFFDNPTFATKLKEYFKDMRKKNTSIIIATQNLSDIAEKKILLDTITQNVPNRIFLPNLNALNPQSVELYKQFNCNEKQIRIIANIRPKNDYYFSSSEGQRVFSLALRPSEIPFVTATAKSDQKAMNEFIDSKNGSYKTGEFIRYWLKYKNATDILDKYEEEFSN